MSPRSDSDRSDNSSLLIEREKTKRLIIMLIVFAAVTVFGMLLVFRGDDSEGTRKVDVNFKDMTVSFTVDKPIGEQVNQPTGEYVSDGRKVEYSTGEINKSVLDKIPQIERASPNRFIGKNLINREGGYLLSAKHPDLWQVTYNPQGMYNNLVPLNTIYANDGTHVNVNREVLQMDMDIETYVNFALQLLISNGIIMQMPEVSYDYASRTAFLSYTNPMTNGKTYQKIILKNGTAFAISGNYNQYLSQQEYIDDVIEMVATFTLLGS